MEHGDYLIDILREDGSLITTKPRREVDKRHDLFCSVYALVVTPDHHFALGALTTDSLFPSKLGVTVGGIVRHNEHADTAVERTLARELTIHTKPILLGRELVVLDIGARRFASAYFLEADLTFPEEEFRLVTLKELDKLVKEGKIIADTLSWFWERYRDIIAEKLLLS